ncbi:hypothetical protein J3U57_12725, partial [Gilliamella sp. B3464]
KAGQALVKEAEKAYHSGDIATGNQLMNQAASHGTTVETTVVRNSGAGKGNVNSEKALSASEKRAIKALEEQIQLHEKKLKEYIKDPYSFDNKDFLKNAPNDEVRQNIINSRIKHLEHEINTFKKNIDKIKKGKD